YEEVLPAFREATWEEALDLVGSRLKAIWDEGGPGAIAGFGSAKCSNEEAYLFQKLIRAGFRTNNVDHCTRLCHASSVAALLERAGQICGIPAETIREVALLWGSAGAGLIFWGMGISQHTTGTDNARCLIAMCCITGNVGRPGTGLHPLRGQNNVQGASDAGL